VLPLACQVQPSGSVSLALLLNARNVFHSLLCLSRYSVTKPCSLQVQPSGSVSLALLLNACLAQAQLDFAPPTARGIREAQSARRRLCGNTRKTLQTARATTGVRFQGFRVLGFFAFPAYMTSICAHQAGGTSKKRPDDAARRFWGSIWTKFTA
jgi:hypothetical protein